MASDPAFMFFYKDWLATTRFMKPEDKGYFVDLLCYQAEYWNIPQNVIDGAIPRSNWLAIRHLFQRNKAGYFNSMQRLHLEKRRKFTESRRLNRLGKVKDKNNTSKSIEQLPDNGNANGSESVIPVKEDVVKGLLENELKIADDDKIDSQGFSWKVGEQIE